MEEKSGHREGVGVLFLGKIFTTEMFKAKETPMTQYITYRRNQTVPVLIERLIKILCVLYTWITCMPKSLFWQGIKSVIL